MANQHDLAVLEAESYIADVPYEVEERLVELLIENDNWRSVAITLRDWSSDVKMLSSDDIRKMEESGSPAREIIKRFIRLHFTVELTQLVCKESGLPNILNILRTNANVEFQYPENDQEVPLQLGKLYEMKVTLFGSPYPELQWYYNNVPIPGKTENQLVLNQFLKEDAGIYQLQAVQNIEGKMKEFWSPTYTLMAARSKPTIAPHKELKDIILEAKEDMILKYEVLAEPDPVYTWYKNGKEIHKSFCNVYKVFGVGVTDEGLYKCEAENSEGICHSAEIRVKVNQSCPAPDVPVIVKHPEVCHSYALRDTVNLYFEVHCKNAVEFRCYINNRIYQDDKRLGTKVVCGKLDDCIHMMTLHYEVHKDDWCRGNLEYIDVRLEAHSQGCSVASSVKIQVEGTPLNQQFSARNKWALLIANDEYLSENVLETPAQDMKALASTLTSLQFRCMTCCNVTKEEFMNILTLFLSYCQKGDYIVFYYAGHGCHNRGVDYMIPLNSESTFGNKIKEQSCIPTTDVINWFQRCDPGLIFYVHDTCRGTSFVKDFQRQESHREAKGNLCLLNATSESYNTYEEPECGSLLMQKLLSRITEKVHVTALCERVLADFRNHIADLDGMGPQVPQCVSDLQYGLSLTDLAGPLPEDYQTVIAKWEERSNVGGAREQTVRVDNADMEVKVKCEQEGCPMIISNSIDVVITIVFKNTSNLYLLEKNLQVTITPNTSDKKITEKVTGTHTPIKCAVKNLQALDNDLCVDLSFTIEGNIMAECKFNLGTPSLCNLMNSVRNEL